MGSFDLTLFNKVYLSFRFDYKKVLMMGSDSFMGVHERLLLDLMVLLTLP